MATIKRNVGQPIRPRLNLGDNASGKFIRAYLSSDGTPLPVPFINLIELETGLYGDNTYLMPAGFEVIDVKFIVYLDGSYSVEDPVYLSATDQYEVDDFDPTNFLPPFPQQVFAQVENGRVDVTVEPPSEISAELGNQSAIDVLVQDLNDESIKIKIEQETNIEGVL